MIHPYARPLQSCKVSAFLHTFSRLAVDMAVHSLLVLHCTLTANFRIETPPTSIFQNGPKERSSFFQRVASWNSLYLSCYSIAQPHKASIFEHLHNFIIFCLLWSKMHTSGANSSYNYKPANSTSQKDHVKKLPVTKTFIFFRLKMNGQAGVKSENINAFPHNACERVNCLKRVTRAFCRSPQLDGGVKVLER